MDQFDIVIAGAGPGGLTAARSAAFQGATVAVFEQHPEVGGPTRTTGGSFIPELRRFGIPERCYHPIHRVTFVSANRRVSFDYPEALMCVLDVRGTFQFLAERAIEAGAVLRLGVAALSPISEGGAVTGCRVRERSGVETSVDSKVLIDATGYRGSLLRQTGICGGSRRFGVGAEYDLFAPYYDQDEAVLLVGSGIAPSGYAWAFPWGKSRVRVGVGVIHADSDAKPEDYLERLMGNAAAFGMNLKGAQPVEYHHGLFPSDGLAPSFAGNGILGVGDAAGHGSALVGEGIRWAMEAGNLAGDVAAEAVRRGDCSHAGLSRFEKQWRKEHGRDLRIASAINRRIARWTDDRWDRGVDLLGRFSPEQFLKALQSDFSARWALGLLWSQPGLLQEALA